MSYLECLTCSGLRYVFILDRRGLYDVVHALIGDDVVECHDTKITEQLTKHAEQIEFSVENHIVETHGTCKACLHSDNQN